MTVWHRPVSTVIAGRHADTHIHIHTFNISYQAYISCFPNYITDPNTSPTRTIQALASKLVTLIESKAPISTVQPSPLAVPGPLPVKKVDAVVLPRSIHCTHRTATTPNKPPSAWKYVPMCPTAMFPFHNNKETKRTKKSRSP